LHLNGALSYSPSIDYDYGSTPSVAGRLGFSFPLGRIAKATPKDEVAQNSIYGQQIAALQAEVKELRSAEVRPVSSAGISVSDPEVSAYLGEVSGDINRLEGEVESRDQQIESLTKRLEELMENQRMNAGTDAAASEATQSLIEILKAQIEDLTARDSSNREEIDNLKTQLQARDQKVNKLQRQFNAIMQKLGLQSSDKP
jgi:prefoldin subunit 5